MKYLLLLLLCLGCQTAKLEPVEPEIPVLQEPVKRQIPEKVFISNNVLGECYVIHPFSRNAIVKIKGVKVIVGDYINIEPIFDDPIINGKLVTGYYSQIFNSEYKQEFPENIQVIFSKEIGKFFLRNKEIEIFSSRTATIIFDDNYNVVSLNVDYFDYSLQDLYELKKKTDDSFLDSRTIEFLQGFVGHIRKNNFRAINFKEE